MIENSKLSHYKIKKIIQCFCIDIPASKTVRTWVAKSKQLKIRVEAKPEISPITVDATNQYSEYRIICLYSEEGKIFIVVTCCKAAIYQGELSMGKLF